MVARLWCLDCGSYFIDKADAVVDLSQVGELVLDNLLSVRTRRLVRGHRCPPMAGAFGAT